MSTQRRQFTAFSRLLHWTMAAMVLTMLCIGVAMVALVGQLPCARIDPSPAGHRDSDPGRRSLREPALESAAAFSGHDIARGGSGGNGVGIHDVWFDVRSPAGRLGNAVGGALSDCPFGSVHLPFILPHDAMLYSVLRTDAHPPCIPLFLTFIAHFGAILFHTLIVRDGILKRMAPWNIRPQDAASTDQTGSKAGPQVATVGSRSMPALIAEHRDSELKSVFRQLTDIAFSWNLRSKSCTSRLSVSPKLSEVI